MRNFLQDLLRSPPSPTAVGQHQSSTWSLSFSQRLTCIKRTIVQQRCWGHYQGWCSVKNAWGRTWVFTIQKRTSVTPDAPTRLASCQIMNGNTFFFIYIFLSMILEPIFASPGACFCGGMWYTTYPRRHGENMQTPHRKALFWVWAPTTQSVGHAASAHSFPRRESNPGPSSCEAERYPCPRTLRN